MMNCGIGRSKELLALFSPLIGQRRSRPSSQCSQLRPDQIGWRSMPTERTCVVLGGSGFLGQRLCKELVRLGFLVRSVSRTGRPRGEAESWWRSIEWISADMGTETSVPALVG